MHALMLKVIVDRCHARIAQGDCPTEPPFPIEQLEEAIAALQARVEAAEGALRAVIDGYDDNDTSDYRRFDAAIAAARAAMGADK